MALEAFQGESLRLKRNGALTAVATSITLQSTPGSHPPSRSNKYARIRVNVAGCKLTLEIQMYITIWPWEVLIWSAYNMTLMQT